MLQYQTNVTTDGMVKLKGAYVNVAIVFLFFPPTYATVHQV